VLIVNGAGTIGIGAGGELVDVNLPIPHPGPAKAEQPLRVALLTGCGGGEANSSLGGRPGGRLGSRCAARECQILLGADRSSKLVNRRGGLNIQKVVTINVVFKARGRCSFPGGLGGFAWQGLQLLQRGLGRSLGLGRLGRGYWIIFRVFRNSRGLHCLRGAATRGSACLLAGAMVVRAQQLVIHAAGLSLKERWARVRQVFLLQNLCIGVHNIYLIGLAHSKDGCLSNSVGFVLGRLGARLLREVQYAVVDQKRTEESE